MNKFMSWIRHLNWNIIIWLCIIPGLAPFTPPHIFEKLTWLFQGTLVRPMDWFDLLFHGLPWVLLLAKLILISLKK